MARKDIHGSMNSSFPWRALPVAVGPLDRTGAPLPDLTSSSSPVHAEPLRPVPLLRPRGRRPLRVLYPPSLSRRPPPQREAPDPARRWLRLLLVLLFLQIYTEETCSATQELQIYSPDVAAPQPQEGQAGSPAARSKVGAAVEERWTVQAVSGASGCQMECVVA